MPEPGDAHSHRHRHPDCGECLTIRRTLKRVSPGSDWNSISPPCRFATMRLLITRPKEMGSSECQSDSFLEAEFGGDQAAGYGRREIFGESRLESRITTPKPHRKIRPLAYEISQRESVSTLHYNVSPIAGIATDSFVANSGGENGRGIGRERFKESRVPNDMGLC